MFTSSINFITHCHDMLNYEHAVLQYEMLCLNFFDGVSEGDGDWIIRCCMEILSSLFKE